MSTSTRPTDALHGEGTGAPVPSAGLPPSVPGTVRRRRLWASPFWWAALEFVGLIAFQAFHQVEHTLELFEKRLGQPQLRPLLGGVDFEWAHFFGNTLLFVCSVAVVLGYGRLGRAQWRQRSRFASTVLLTGIAVQGTHVVEHVTRVVQYLNGSKVPEGLATRWIDPVWFHFGINMVFFAGLIVGFVGLDVHRDLMGRGDLDRVAVTGSNRAG